MPFEIEEYQKTRKALADSTAKLGDQGLFTPEMYDEMLRYIEEYRSERSGE